MGRHIGSLIDLVTAPGASDYTDVVNVSATISTIPEPSSIAFASLAIIGFAAAAALTLEAHSCCR
jgi:hypothetical protein